MPADSIVSSAFYVPARAEVANVEIRNLMDSGETITISGGTIDGVIARSKKSPESTCGFSGGTVRNSACIAAGGGSAIGTNICCSGNFHGVVRNSTLIATGPDSIGMEFIYEAYNRRSRMNLDVVGSLIAGEEKDVKAIGVLVTRGRGAKVDLDLRGSRYATVETRGEGLSHPAGHRGQRQGGPVSRPRQPAPVARLAHRRQRRRRRR
jgi:hypothetical protein